MGQRLGKRSAQPSPHISGELLGTALIDVVNIDVGAYWQTRIADLIEASDKVLVIVTDGFWKSKNCLEEYNVQEGTSGEDVRVLEAPHRGCGGGRDDRRCRPGANVRGVGRRAEPDEGLEPGTLLRTDVNVGEVGSVGERLADLTVGQLVTQSTEFLTRDGDINQEDLTNDAVAVWARMDCYHFSLTDNPGVNHFELPADADVLARLVANAATPRSDCD